ncbi:MAG: gamma-glutamyltransferase [Betaproteobacteria bacterium]|jgi:gamma-glutamyltranspeptidase/glutathione hydrolase|nr:gamma-glutamyltransferase [Rhodocyclaceae bacterium]MCA3134435.1 gamma-glutamyltransferase [Rhodocyclaceae bacterium]MCA3142418.1 gamma-glutamyltransferase [Rhodocyclaceae bacterium]MCA3145000.1 gamma-glutamyltransferase [Rhodocyclaceae bacterium]MCE2898649.1 gamma-glutamyltransferase [Betaproteobacteria bacterium]
MNVGFVAGRRVLLRLAALGWLALLAATAHGGGSAVASAHPLATRAGEQVLAAGGNAFDAAVAVAAVLAVVEPYASGLGGGGFFLVHRASDGWQAVVDARETAPRAAGPDFYLDATGKAEGRASLDGARAAAIPGLPAGLAHVAKFYGTRALSETLAPAIRLAEEGFSTDARYGTAAAGREAALRADGRTAAVFLADGAAPAPGHRVRQPHLARTLRALADHGADGFYFGAVAEELVRSVRAAGGVWSAHDLAGYRVIERRPVRIRHGGATVTTAPLPSSGGLVLAQALQILERLEAAAQPQGERDHLVVEALRRGYQDRARWMGDPGFVAVPEARLASPGYAARRAAGVDRLRATPSAALGAEVAGVEGEDTTHFSIVDTHGNRVAATLSINGPFGAALLAGDTGVLLNNEMDDFVLAPGTANLYGLTGGEANLIAPGKRPLSSMSPTFVEDERGVLVLGTPGGSRIISMVLLAILEHLGSPVVDLERVVGRPRFHHQFLPDRVEIEPGQFAPEWRSALEALGHTVQEGRRRWGNMQAVFADRRTGEASAAGDPRARAGVPF